MVNPINTHTYSATTHGAGSTSDVSKVDGGMQILKGDSSVGTSRFERLFNGAQSDFRNLVQQQGTLSFEELMSPFPR
jgi:hypothetical protein